MGPTDFVEFCLANTQYGVLRSYCLIFTRYACVV